MSGAETPAVHDDWLFGWDATPGIVSVWADSSGRALVWSRVDGVVRCDEDRFRPWIVAASLDDVSHLGDALVAADAPRGDRAPFSYRELDGPPDALRYLLSARDGRVLRAAVLQGAQRRLGRAVRGIHDLRDDYYTAGSVEQYLMSTGKVCFRGLAYDDLHRMQIDLETTALSPIEGRIFMVAVRDSRGLETILEAPRATDEAALIDDLCALVRSRDPDVVENHNLFGFDLPFLTQRAAVLGVPLRLGRPEGSNLLHASDEPRGWEGGRRTRYSVAGRELIDTIEAVRRHNFSVGATQGYGLKAAARLFGLEPPDRTFIDGPDIYRTYKRDPERVRRYAFDDVAAVDGLSRRLMGASFALAGMTPRRYERAASAGPAIGVLEPMLVRAYLRAGAALPRHASRDDALLDPHKGGSSILYAGGVVRHVVKADIASMYPSIMRAFRIGPSCDPLGVLLSLVDRLTTLRLHYKQEARAAPAGTPEAHRHHAIQAAMKIVVNAAYGYLAAGDMALFADRRAADAVTARGREILGQVVDALRARGLLLIEADTDGVFFGTPDHWTERDERACIAAVAATLPPGVNLEHEGRYKAMLSHEIKNYALLTYDSDLILRGASLRSMRTEPFGDRFLRAALRCILEGDCVGMRQVYLDVVAALKERRLTPDDVATTFRLTKTPEEYARSRGRAREAAYEALLDGGRTSWRVGERVRCYHSVDGRARWLPQAQEHRAPRIDDEAMLTIDHMPDYDVARCLKILHTSYVSRLRKAFGPDDFEQLFRPAGQAGLFDKPFSAMQPLWLEPAPLPS